ncbi:Aldehyde dehydrogenase [Mycobacterium tuberculosis]|nr:Aldehyde dehydrogenase [Mycobacterium tuberculosis]
MVGLTAYLEQVRTGVWDIPAGYLPADYFEGITMAGGVAVLLPPQPVDPESVGCVLDSLHALVITGGYDLDPAAYGQEPHPATDHPRPGRDAWEFALLRGALQRGMPVLGICRGTQVLNVALGGTLHQHLPDILGHGRRQRIRGPAEPSGATMSTTQLINPATEEVLASVDHTDANAVDDAVQRARAAQRRWARLAPAQRAAGLRAFAAAVQAHLDELAALEVANSGHPIVSAEWEAGHVRDVLAFYAASPERLSGRQIPVAGGVDVTFNEPMGVVGVITPWNFPMVIASWAIAPALAAGNAVLVKPAELTPLTTMRLGELAVEAGLDEDLLQVLPGKGTVVGERFVTHPDIRKIVFTGSTEVGKRVMAGAAAQVKRVTLELGGKSANIVFHDCDLERAATTAPAGVFDNAGQDCCARSRILVQRSVYDRFMELLEPAVHSIVVGDPGSRATEMGPLVSRAHRDKVAGYVPDDAPVAFRGTAPAGRGFWFPPTVLTPKRGDRTVTDEIFGPVVVVLTFDDEADAISLANDTAYGLSGSIWTDDLSRALRVARAVESGNLSVNSHSSVRFNTPFGGFKQSGVGRELGPDAPLQFTETKNVFIAVGEEM